MPAPPSTPPELHITEVRITHTIILVVLLDHSEYLSFDIYIYYILLEQGEAVVYVNKFGALAYTSYEDSSLTSLSDFPTSSSKLYGPYLDFDQNTAYYLRRDTYQLCSYDLNTQTETVLYSGSQTELSSGSTWTGGLVVDLAQSILYWFGGNNGNTDTLYSFDFSSTGSGNVVSVNSRYII